ncbi:uncharacterized protein METZ01_LOCUS198838 [marine metagenome]|uniref:Response regulatory domain-containing protein n=1 Tax=marine metagenome TaxID=408172 RepID=A0A382E7C2_9ZZZZ
MSEVKQKSVLVIENDDSILESLSNRFKKRGMLPITAKDGYEGYTRVCNESPDLIVSETLLPSIDGYRLSRLLKFDDRFKDIPIILMTSNKLESVKSQVDISGANEIIGKPFRFKDLITVIEKVIK